LWHTGRMKIMVRSFKSLEKAKVREQVKGQDGNDSLIGENRSVVDDEYSSADVLTNSRYTERRTWLEDKVYAPKRSRTVDLVKQSIDALIT
jgi:hypothetical protein